MASQGGALSVIETRPSGRGHDRIGALQQHDRARSRRRGFGAIAFRRNFSCLGLALNRRANSPSCGVSTVGAATRDRIAANSISGVVRKARQRVGVEHHSPFAGQGRQHRLPHRRPDAPAGAEHHGVEPRIAPDRPQAPSAPSTGRTMTARLLAALTASASRGLAMVTRPAPARSAPRAASRAAPVCDGRPTPPRHGRAGICARRAAAPESAPPRAPAHWRRCRDGCSPAPPRECRCRRPRPSRNAAAPAAADGPVFSERTSPFRWR